MARVTALLIGLIIKEYTLQPIEAQLFQLPARMKILEGSCVVIPCKFAKIKSKPIIKWQNSKKEEIYNSKNSSLVLKSYLGRASLVGDLAKGNCTLRINKVGSSDAGRYFPHIDSDPPTWKAESNDSVDLSSMDKPDPIWISGPTTMTEGKDYQFRCNCRHTCPANPPKITWTSWNQLAKTQHIELPNGEWETSSLIQYKADWESDGETLKCKADYPNNKVRETQSQLQILYAPKNVSVQSSHDSDHVRKDDNIGLTCLGFGNPDILIYTWYKDNQSIPGGDFEILYINATMEDKSGEYYCVAANDVGETQSEPITLLCSDCDPPRTLYWGGMVAAVGLLLLIILAAVTVIWYRRRKKALMPPKPATTETSAGTNIYMNIQVSGNQGSITESPYEALQTHNRCPDYEQLQLRDLSSTTQKSLQTSSSYSEYEEIIPYRSQQNAKRKCKS